MYCQIDDVSTLSDVKKWLRANDIPYAYFDTPSEKHFWICVDSKNEAFRFKMACG